MKNKKIVTIIGARPQFIKAATISHSLIKKTNIEEILIHTGQHYDKNMSSVFFSELNIPAPKYNLGINGGNHGAMTGAQLAEIEKVMIKEKPDVAVVYGDTNSTLAGALAASKLHIPIAHVEAGLRSFNRLMPEEINRIVTDHISDALFAPTETAMNLLAKEGIPKNKCYLSGDIMFDAALYFGEIAKTKSNILTRLKVKNNYVLATVHRAENTDNLDRLKIIITALVKVSKSILVIWPLHPRTRQLIKEYGLENELESGNIHLIEPVGYLDMLMLEQNSSVIATDSGGVQKEAFFYKVPCVTLRTETEWVELIEAKWNTLSPPFDVNTVCNSIKDALGSKGELISPYGEGNSADKIAQVLEQL